MYQEHLAAAGYYFGASRDFWIVVTTCTLGMVLSFAALYGCVYKKAMETASQVRPTDASDTDSEEAEEEGGMGILYCGKGEPPRPVFSRGFIQRRILGYDLNPDFAFAAELAFRAALVCTFCGTSYALGSMAWLNDYGWSMQYVVVIIAFTAYTSAGVTYSLAFSGMVGTFLSVANTLVLFRFFPDGVEGPDPIQSGRYSQAWYVGAIDFVVFFCIILFFNFPNNARMFALSWQAYFTMCYLNPNNTVIFSTGFKDVSLYGAAIGPLMGTMGGIILSVLINILPEFLGFGAMSALVKAQELTILTAWQEGKLWSRFLVQCEAGWEGPEVKAFGSELTDLRAQVKQIGGSLNDAWWECMDLGHLGRARGWLQIVQAYFDRSFECLQAAFLAMEDVAIGGKGERKSNLLQAAMPEMKTLARASWTLANMGAHIASFGGVDKDSEDELQACLEETQAATQRLAQVFAKARRQELASRGGEALPSSSVHQHALAYSLSGYAASSICMAERLLDEEELDSGIGPITAFIQAVKDLPSTLWNGGLPDACRSALTYFVVFIFGRYGLTHVIPDWNSTPPGTVAYLLSSSGHKGSALKKNFDRFVGVSFGTMMGQFIYVIACTLKTSYPPVPSGWPETVQLGMFFMFEFGGFYLYFASARYSYVGLLIACFGAEHILLECGVYGVDESDSDASVYQNLMGQLVAIISSASMDNQVSRAALFVVATVCLRKGLQLKVNVIWAILAGVSAPLLERVIGNTPAWCLATDALMNFKDLFNKTLAQAIRQSEDDSVTMAKGVALLSAMADEGREADMEPRLDKTKWRTSLWDRITENSSRMWKSLAALYHAKCHTSCCRNVDKLPTLARTCDDLQGRVDSTLSLALRVMKHSTVLPIHPGPALTHSWENCLPPQVLAEVNTRLAESHLGPTLELATLLDDEACAVSSVMIMVDALMGHVASLEDCLAQVPELYHGLVGEDDMRKARVE